MLKLKGHVSYAATRLCGMYLAKTAKAIAAQDVTEGKTIDKFNAAMGYLRSQPDEDLLMEEMGLEVNSGMWATIKAMVCYVNKLNFDLQDLLDPPTNDCPQGPRRLKDKNVKLGFGVTVNHDQRKENWQEGMKLHQAEEKEDLDTDTYEQYLEELKDVEGDSKLTEAQWIAAQIEDSNLWDDHAAVIVDALMAACDGREECEFDELPIRTQIAAIENMRGKIPSIIDATLRRVGSNRTLSKSEKTVEMTKQKCLVNGFDKLFIEMLGSSRYANFTEFMRTFSPTREGTVVESRQMKAKIERVEVKTFLDSKLSEETMSKLTDDFLELASDEV